MMPSGEALLSPTALRWNMAGRELWSSTFAHIYRPTNHVGMTPISILHEVLPVPGELIQMSHASCINLRKTHLEMA